MRLRQGLRDAVTWLLGLTLVIAGVPLRPTCASSAGAQGQGMVECCCAGAEASCCSGTGEAACGCEHGQLPPSRGVASGEQRIEFAPAEDVEPLPFSAAADAPPASMQRTPAWGLRPFHAAPMHVELSVFLI